MSQNIVDKISINMYNMLEKVRKEEVTLKKFWCFLLSAVIISFFLPLMANAESTAENQCGESLFWSFDAETATLIISGDGEMKNFSSARSTPWKECSIDHIVIENGATSIGNCAFDSLYPLSVTFPDTLVRIGDRAFFGCGLTELTIPANVVSIGENAFAFSEQLCSVVMQTGSLSVIGTNAFYRCAAMETLVLPQNPVLIEGQAFAYTAVQTLSVPQGFAEIGEQAFSNMEELESVKIAGSVHKIRERAFSGCRNLTELVLEEGLTEIGQEAFIGYCGLETVSFPNSLKTIGDYAFYNCNYLKDVVFGNGLEDIGNMAFQKTALKSVFLPKSVVYCSSVGFDHAVTVYGVPGSVAANANSFIPLPDLTVTLLSFDRVEFFPVAGMEYSIDGKAWQSEPLFTGLARDTFYTFYHRYAKDARNDASPCGTSLTVKTKVGERTESDYWDYNAADGSLTVSGGGYLQNYGSSWSEQGWSAYKNNIKALTVLNTDQIGTFAFAKLTKLQTLSFSDGLRVIAAHAFENAVNLHLLTLPASIEEIGDYAFARTGLAGELDLSHVLVIGDNAFTNCHDLTLVRFSENPLYIGFSAFSCGDEVTFIFPKEAEFIAPDFWKDCKMARIVCQKNSMVEIYAKQAGVPYDIFGDLNGDKDLNAQDLLQLKRVLLNNEYNVLVADVNGDGAVNILDMVRLKKILTNI